MDVGVAVAVTIACATWSRLELKRINATEFAQKRKRRHEGLGLVLELQNRKTRPIWMTNHASVGLFTIDCRWFYVRKPTNQCDKKEKLHSSS